MTISTISEAFEVVKEAVDKADNQAFLVAVSYTHLTLPTTPYV